jgi:hypothetical protein
MKQLHSVIMVQLLENYTQKNLEPIQVFLFDSFNY